jgi:poly(A) polymerase
MSGGTMDAVALRATAAEMARRLQSAGHVAYFAGGCVRDELLGRKPHDYDIATDATPPEVLRLFPRAQFVGAHFGVVVVPEGGEMFEIATFRTDGSYRDGRRPETVTFATPREDAQRRDFTVNGMFLDPGDGRVIDYVGGQEDLRARVLRAIGDPVQRFREDRLRLMRAVRFAAALDYQVEESTWAALGAEAGSLREISVERVRDELVRILLHRSRLRGFDLLDESGLLRVILPEMEAMKGCSQPPEYHPEGDVWTHTRLMLSLLPEEAPLPLVLSVLLHDAGKPATRSVDPAEGRIRFNGHDRVGAGMAESILTRLKFPNQIISAVVTAVANHMKFMHVREMRPAKVRRWLAEPGFADELELHRVDCLGSNGLLDNWEFMRTKLTESAEARALPPWLVNGRDLLAAGYASGPRMAAVLRDVHDAQLEGQVGTKEEAMAWVMARHPV